MSENVSGNVVSIFCPLYPDLEMVLIEPHYLASRCEAICDVRTISQTHLEVLRRKSERVDDRARLRAMRDKNASNGIVR